MKLVFLTVLMITLVAVTACSNDEKQVSFQSSGTTQTFAEGKNAIPANFPLPIYPQAATTGSVASQDEGDQDNSKFLMLSTSASMASVSQFYQSQLPTNGWKIVSVQTLPSLINIACAKDDYDSSVMISADTSHKTIIQLSVSKNDQTVASHNNGKSDKIDKFNPPTD